MDEQVIKQIEDKYLNLRIISNSKQAKKIICEHDLFKNISCNKSTENKINLESKSIFFRLNDQTFNLKKNLSNKLKKYLIILIFYFIFNLNFCKMNTNIDLNLSSTFCPSAKQINGLKSNGFNLNCDCTQTTDGQTIGWEIICYSIENFHQSSTINNKLNLNESKFNDIVHSSLPSIGTTIKIKFNNSNEVEEVTSDNITSGFGDEKLDFERETIAESLIAPTNLEYLNDLNSYQNVPIVFSIKYIKNQMVIIECYEGSPNFKPAMFQDFKIDEIDAFKLLNCVLPDIPFNILFHRTNLKTNSTESSITHIRSLKLETLHTQSMDLNQFKKLFTNLESLEFLYIDNYELDINGKGLRMKRQISLNANNMNLNRNFRTNSPIFNPITNNPFNSFNISTGNNRMNRPLVSSLKPNLILNSRMIANNFSLNFPLNNYNFDDHSTILFKYSDKIIPTPILTNRNSTNRVLNSVTKNNILLKNLSSNSFRIPSSATVNRNLSPMPSFLSPAFISPSPSFATIALSNSIQFTRINTLPSPSFNSNTNFLINKTITNEENNAVRTKAHLLVNMLNRRNNTLRNNLQAAASSTNIRKLNLNFINYFPNIKILKLRSLLTNYDKDNAYFVQEMLTKLTHLQSLELNKNIIQVLPNSLFADLTNLNSLYLNHNQIQLIEKNVFHNLHNLEMLELVNNDLKDFHSDTFKYLTNLKRIKLKRNKFQNLPENLFSSNINLVELDISQNKDLINLPDNFLQNLINLNNLSLFDCNLSNISPNPQKFFFNAPELRVIYMRNNRLKKLTTKNLFAYNHKLLKLDLSYNDISIISSEIFSINSSSLLELNLYANNLIDVPNNVFTNLRNLRILNLGYNNLTKIDGSIFFTLKNLEELDLSKNLLTTINPQKYALPFGIGTNLRVVNLSHNKLTSFADEFNVINWNLYLMLHELNISNNLLQGHVLIPVFYSGEMKLDLRVNQITTILMNEIELHELSLIEQKKLDNSFSNKGTQTYVYLANNPIVCDCRLFNFVNYTRTSNIKYNSLIEKINFDLDYIECRYPEPLKRTLIEELNDAYLSCSIKDSRICPKNCNCEFVNKFRQFNIDCQLKNLSKPPSNLFSIANYDEINLDALNEKLSINQIDSISINLQHNLINDLNLFNRFSFKNSFLSKKRIKPFLLELYLDNNTITKIPDNFLSNIFFLSKKSSTPLSQKQSLSSPLLLQPSSSPPLLPLTSSFSSFSSPLSSASLSSPSFSIFSSSPSPSSLSNHFETISHNNQTSNFRMESNSQKLSSQPQFSLKTLSLTNNQLENMPIEFLKTLESLALSQSKQMNLSPFKLYLSSNPFNCTPVQSKTTTKNKSTSILNQTELSVKTSCNVKEMKNWITKNYNLVGDLGDIYCLNALNKNSTRQLIQFTDEQLCPQEIEDQTTTLMFLIFCLVIAFLLFIITILYFKNRHTILAFIYIHVNPIFICLSFNEEDLDKEKLYDAFVSYSSQDRDVVMQLIEHLEKPSKQTSNAINFLQSKTGNPTFHEANSDKIVPDLMQTQANNSNAPKVTSLKSTSNQAYSFNLSNGINTLTSPTMQLNAAINNSDLDEYSDFFKLCIHERDWLPGQLISWNIINSVRNSRRTILILSKSFIESIWFKIEFHTAYYQMLEDKIDRLIVIVRGDFPAKQNLDKDLAFLLSTKTYLVWGEKWFWEKLRYSLPHKKSHMNRNKKMLKKPLMNGDDLKLHNFGTYSSPNTLSNLNNNKASSKMSSKAKYMQECVDNAIADYYQLNTSTSIETGRKANSNKKNDALAIKLKNATTNQNKRNEQKNAFHVNQCFEKETETSNF